jgi:hypothetical protein
MSRLVSLLFIISALFLNSCVYVNTRRACADIGQECQAVILPDQENLVIYKHRGKLYLQGVLTKVRREGRDIVSSFKANDFSSGQFVPVPDAPQHYVYREIGPADIERNDIFGIVPGKEIPEGARAIKRRRQVVGYRVDALNCNPVTTHLQYGWIAELPGRARPHYRHMVTSEHQHVGSHLCNTRRGFIIPVTPSRTNKHAWYAYPLAGVSFVLVDVPGTVLANTVVPAAYGIAAIPFSIYEKGRRIMVKPTK